MNDPHVARLVYSVVIDGGVSFSPTAQPVVYDQPEFHGLLDGERLTFDLHMHVASVEDARLFLDPHVSGWQLNYALASGREELRFVFREAEVVDRAPTPGVATATASFAQINAFDARVEVSVTRTAYPPAPTAAAEPLGLALWARFEAFSRGREPLAAMAYFCLTNVEAEAGGRVEAATRFGVSRGVLDTLARLTGPGIGDPPRKIVAGRQTRPHTDSEVQWLHIAMREIIRRVAFPPERMGLLTLGDLPRL